MEHSKRTWAGWPWDNRYNETPRKYDIPPERTNEGHFVVYHATTPACAEKIIAQQHVKPYDIFAVVWGTITDAIRSYGMKKAGEHYVILRIILASTWINNVSVRHEIGGSGNNQFLFIRPGHMDKWLGITPDGIVQIEICDDRTPNIFTFIHEE